VTSLAEMARTRWPHSTGMRGRIEPEQVAKLNRNGWPVMPESACSAQLQFDPARRHLDDIIGAILDEGFAPSAVVSISKPEVFV